MLGGRGSGKTRAGAEWVRRLASEGVTPIALVFSAIYACGIWLVHASAGWFVVGLGRNGAEYSVLIIACLLAHAWAHRKPSSLSI